MAIGNPGKRTASLGVLRMLAALVLSAFLGAGAGLIWQNSGWIGGPEEEVVTAEAPSGG